MIVNNVNNVNVNKINKIRFSVKTKEIGISAPIHLVRQSGSFLLVLPTRMEI